MLRRIKRDFWLYIYVLPALVYLFFFNYMPMYGVQVAFRLYNPALGMRNSPWVGLRYIVDFVSGFYFWTLLKNTITISVYSFLVGFPIPIVLALLLNELRHAGFKRFSQTALYMPHFISMVVMCGIIVTFLSPSSGMINHFIRALGLEEIYFMSIPTAFKHIYVWSGIWQGMGWSAIIYLAALSNVDPELLEAATIDGASRIQKIRYINIPTIQPTITLLLIMSIGSLIGVGFDKAFLLQNPLNVSQAEVISTYIYKRAFNNVSASSWSYSAAVGFFNNIVNLILLLFANTLARTFGNTSLF